MVWGTGAGRGRPGDRAADADRLAAGGAAVGGGESHFEIEAAGARPRVDAHRGGAARAARRGGKARAGRVVQELRLPGDRAAAPCYRRGVGRGCGGADDAWTGEAHTLRRRINRGHFEGPVLVAALAIQRQQARMIGGAVDRGERLPTAPFTRRGQMPAPGEDDGRIGRWAV